MTHISKSVANKVFLYLAEYVNIIIIIIIIIFIIFNYVEKDGST